jgi:hypothetical protein
MKVSSLLSTAVLIGSSADVSAFTPIANSPSHTPLAFSNNNINDDDGDMSRRSALATVASILTTATAPLLLQPRPAFARLEGVNNPSLLPATPGLNVIQVEKFLTSGQEKRMNDLLERLEKDTGYRVRVLCQAYPRTPG